MNKNKLNKHQVAKDRKWYGGGVKSSESLSCAECGRKISDKEDQRNDGLCDGCFDLEIDGAFD
jgi:hypothetical protein